MRNVIQTKVPLAPLTTLELGGEAEFFVRCDSEDDIVGALSWAKRKGVPARILGGGSNVIVPDEGVSGLVLHVQTRGRTLIEREGYVELKVAAGENWDELVAFTVAQGLVGFECLSGIPGCAGSTPIQNVGAYGHEVADSLVWLRALERETGEVHVIAARDCAFGYRDSRFKQAPDRFVVLDMCFALKRDVPPVIRYAELERALSAHEAPGAAVSAERVRETVLRLRARKSMVLDKDDPNGRSAGSFFTNPIVVDAEADAVIERAIAQGIVADASEVPRYPAGEGRSKLAAGWLIERAGMSKGTRRGAVGISSKHALALVHHGGGQARELLAFAEEVRAAVKERFGVTLTREPVLWTRG